MAEARNQMDREILELLIQGRKRYAESVKSIETVIVDESYCIPIGSFQYKDKKVGRVSKRLYRISDIVDDEYEDIIYDENGKIIAYREEENGMQLEIAGDVSLDKNTLEKQIKLAEERAAQGLPAPEMGGENKAGEGRSLGKNEHESKQEENKEKQEEKKKEEESKAEEKSEEQESEEEKSEEEQQENKPLKNLHYKINIDSNPRICLNEIINGYYLWQILGLDEKLEGRLPDGLDPTSFGTGFLSFTSSKQLDEIDALDSPSESLEPRKSQDTFVIETLNGDIVELDSTVLKMKELGTSIEKQRAEQRNLRLEDGEEAKKPETNMVATRTSLFEIPGVAERFPVGENWYLGVDFDEDYMRNGKMPVGCHTKNISFVQVSRNRPHFEREERIQGTLETRLRSIDEPAPISKKAFEMEQQLRKYDPAEAENIRVEHIKSLVDECFDKYPSLGDYYNRNDIARKVGKYHSQGASDEEVLKQIGEEVDEAGNTEHPIHLPGEDRKWH